MNKYLLSKSTINLFAGSLIAVSFFLPGAQLYASEPGNDNAQRSTSVKSLSPVNETITNNLAAKSAAISVDELLAAPQGVPGQTGTDRYCADDDAIDSGGQSNTAKPTVGCMSRQFSKMFGGFSGNNSFQDNNPVAMMFRWCTMFSSAFSSPST